MLSMPSWQPPADDVLGGEEGRRQPEGRRAPHGIASLLSGANDAANVVVVVVAAVFVLALHLSCQILLL